ncbi:signal recognition particle protein [Sulfurihydrogenibium azorense]|jgi:signal recognition particle subunit SRP54|uniref:Signal recognition particle protein n=1 Tax=Sulfurihydrogenibium azorense (strain DSM 15241 / OCM 825 / Az-Fu1) TaxID=204536 RepID=C1DV61_SULAA|nr:signal recognition particle protein [Sulfurihydrogenibium azorense]ACN98744.1 signal recognition particle protein [Sulfurihydrogenibium azorense Az-Fu1]MDM7273192.1 signal recognition particle protein [Sulfurihydrogenibium azorense]
MFELLTEKFSSVIDKLRKAKKIDEKTLDEALKDIRTALLEADVNVDVVKKFIADIKQKVLGQELIKGLSAGETVIKLIYDETINILGGEEPPTLAKPDKPPAIIMLVGLQGTGKTTTAGKLAKYLKSKGYRVGVASTDVRRPAAAKQLCTLAQSIDVPCFVDEQEKDALKLTEKVIEDAKKQGFSYIILDTAGRLHIDQELMEELKQIKEKVKPAEVLYVADAMQGQEAITTAEEFHKAVGLTGVILTKLDGDAKGGIALSVRQVLGIPIKFVGTGEKIEDLDLFYPDRIAQRILGLGDIQTLIEKMQAAIDEDKAKQMAEKVMNAEFTLEDLREQIRMIRNLGPMEQILKMIPGIGSQLKNIKVDEKQFIKIEAIINSMTPEERMKPHIINGSRKRRIAKGSGTTILDVNKVLKQYEEMKKMMKKMKKMTKSGGFPFRLPF